MAESIGGLIAYIGGSGGAAAGAGTAAGTAGGAAAGTGLGTALTTGVASAAVGAGLNAVLARRGGISIPPPPGAAMIDPAGSAAAAQVRQRQAVAGGLGSTNLPGATTAPAISGPTSGGKSLLGQ